MITFGKCVESVLKRLAMVEGLDAQIYAEPRVQLAVQHKFDLLFREYWHPDYTTVQEEYVLDGATGQVTADLSDKIKDWRDLHSVFWENSHKPLPLAPMNVRDVDITYPSIRRLPVKVPSTAPLVTNKIFKILPASTVGKVYITYRTKPDDFEEDSDQIYMDTQMLICGTCWDVLEDDGTNPGASDKFRILFQDALTQFNRQQFHIPHDLIMASRSTVNRWT